MNRKHFVLAAAVVISTQVALGANGVEKRLLPSDAHDVVLVSAKIAQYPVGTKANKNPLVAHEGYPDEGVFAPMLAVTFAYQSASAKSQGSGPDGQSYSWDDNRAKTTIVLDAPKALIAAIQHGRIRASEAIAYKVKTETSTIKVPGFGKCEFNYQSGMNVDSNCSETDAVKKVVSPVLSVQLK